MLYAAYASSLDPDTMRRRAPHSPLRGTGWLTGWRLAFAGEELGWDGPIATVVEASPHEADLPEPSVFVALYEVSDADENAMDEWEGLDLRTFYDENRPLFWSLYAAYVLLVSIARILRAVGAGASFGGVFGPLLPNLVLLSLFVALAGVRNRVFHGIAVAALLALLLAEWSRLSLG